MTLGSPTILSREEGRALLAQQGAKKNQKQPAKPRTAPAPTKDTKAPVASGVAQVSAAVGLAGVQVWNGVDGQGSVLRFFELSPEDKKALLAFAAERGIHPVRR